MELNSTVTVINEQGKDGLCGGSEFSFFPLMLCQQGTGLTCIKSGFG